MGLGTIPLCARASVVCAWLLILSAPLVQAGGRLDAIVAVVHVEDRYGQDCEYPAAGFCQFRYQRNETIGDSSIELYQQFDYIGIASDFSILRDQMGETAWLLPDRAVMHDFSTLYVEHPLFTTPTEAWAAHGRRIGPVELVLTEDNISAAYPVVDRSNPTGPLKPHYFEIMEYALEGEGDIEYRGVRPLSDPVNDNLDEVFQALPKACHYAVDPCTSVMTSAGEKALEETPEVRFGWGFRAAQVATDPQNLTPPEAAVAMPDLDLAVAPLQSLLQEPEEQVEDKSPPPKESLSGPSAEGRPSDPRPRPGPEATAPMQLQSHPVSPPIDGGPALLLAGAAAAAAALLAALGFGLYSRFNSRDDVLASETRARLLALVEAQPGVSLPELVEATGLARNTLRHHLQVLARLKLVRMGEEGGRLVVFAMGAKAGGLPVWVRRNAACVAILEALRARPEGLTREEVHALLPEVPARTRNHHLRRLLGAGALVQVDDPSGDKRLLVSPGAMGGEPVA